MTERLRKSRAARRRQEVGGDRARLPRRPAPSDASQAVSPVAAARLLLAASEHLEGSGLRPAVANQLRALQATQGNQYVQRTVRRAERRSKAAAAGTAPIQRQEETKDDIGSALKMRQGESKDAALKMCKELLDPAKTKPNLFNLDLTLEPPTPPWAVPPKPGEAPAGEKKPPWKPGAGPKKPRPATGKDVAKAVAAIPDVDKALTGLQAQALAIVKRDYGKLKTGEKAALITTGVVFASAALAGIASSPEARDFALKQLHGRNLPVPGTPVQVKFLTSGKEKGVMFTVDVASLVRSLTGK